MPEVAVSKATKKTRAFKRDLYHEAIYDLLAPIREAQKCGDFYWVNSTTRE